jgi:predicted dehydrogenase
VGWIGAGAFSTGTLLPAFREAGFERFVAVATASGVSARRAAERHGFEKAVSGAAAVIDDPDVSVVVIATPHEVHAELARQALSAGRDVWCEKPLALTGDDLDEVEKAWRDSGRQLALGFNRRWAPAVQAARRVLAEVKGPKLIVYRIAAGRVPDGHW